MGEIKHVFIRKPTGGMYKVINDGYVCELDQRTPTYSTDLVLGADRYPEYLLIQHLPPKNIFEYFTGEV